MGVSNASETRDSSIEEGEFVPVMSVFGFPTAVNPAHYRFGSVPVGFKRLRKITVISEAHHDKGFCVDSGNWAAVYPVGPISHHDGFVTRSSGVTPEPNFVDFAPTDFFVEMVVFDNLDVVCQFQGIGEAGGRIKVDFFGVVLSFNVVNPLWANGFFHDLVFNDAVGESVEIRYQLVRHLNTIIPTKNLSEALTTLGNDGRIVD